MKKINTLQDYVSLAASTDISRPNLCCLYRTDSRLIATDGHRFHVQNNLSLIDKPIIVNAFSAMDISEYPDTNYVLSSKTSCRAILYLCASVKYKEYKAFLKSIENLLPFTRKGSHDAILSYSDNEIKLSIISDSFKCEYVLNGLFFLKEQEQGEFSISFNLSYFLDALNLPESSMGYPIPQLSIQINQPDERIVITSTDTMSIIMPIRS